MHLKLQNMIFLYILYVAAKFAYNTQIQLGGGPKYTWGGGGGGLSPREPTHLLTPIHPPPTPHPRGGGAGGGGDENVKTINTVTTSKDNAFFSIPLSPLKYRLVNIAALTE